MSQDLSIVLLPFEKLLVLVVHLDDWHTESAGQIQVIGWLWFPAVQGSIFTDHYAVYTFFLCQMGKASDLL